MGALGSSRHTRSSGMLRVCSSDRTPRSWHSACAVAGGLGAGSGKGLGAEVVEGLGGEAEGEGEAERAAERDALAAGERCVKAMVASGPASVRMCWVGACVACMYERGCRGASAVGPGGTLNVECLVLRVQAEFIGGVCETSCIIVSPRVG
jgi:hypothetical protein